MAPESCPTGPNGSTILDQDCMEHWYALYTKAQKEHHVAQALESQGLEVFLPTVPRSVRRRDRPRDIVLFPCYLFARIDFETVPRSSIAWMPGIRRIVSTGEQPTVVPAAVVEHIRDGLDRVEVFGYGGLKRGDPIKIVSGPLAGLNAVFERPLPPSERVRILVEVLGRLTPAEIDFSQIERRRNPFRRRRRR
jgi:transcriptional antiterminator RfaH